MLSFYGLLLTRFFKTASPTLPNWFENKIMPEIVVLAGVAPLVGVLPSVLKGHGFNSSQGTPRVQV